VHFRARDAKKDGSTSSRTAATLAIGRAPLYVQGSPETTMSVRQFVLSLSTLPLKLFFLGGWFAMLMAWERAVPAAPKPQDMTLTPSARVGGNVTLGLINLVVWFMVTLPLTVMAIGASPVNGFFDWRVGSIMQGISGLIIDIVLLDLFAYFWHRMNHESDVLWRFHSVHHRDEFLDVTTGLRFHFGEAIFGSAFRAVVICAIACPLEHVLVFDALMMVMNWFSHSNLRLPAWYEKILSLVFVMPSYHWTHHRTMKPEIDQNYGVLFTFWDFLFRTRAERARRIGMAVGIRHEPDMPLGGLLVQPFRKQD
jgi:sterol desaturase/sphingolipid hydroxylase (fatty acid hydroxylase superfamily)